MNRNARRRMERQPLIPFVFRVIREEVGGETVRILLEPYGEEQIATLRGNDEFITGGLAVDPWPKPNSAP